MMQDKVSSPFGLVLVLVLVAVLLLLQAGYMLWRNQRGPAARRIEKRLHLLAAASDKTRQAQLLKERMLSEVPLLSRWLLRMPRLQGLDQLLVQAGLDWTVSRLLLGCGALALSCLALMWLVLAQPFALALFVALLAGALPLLFAAHRKAGRLNRLEKQLPDALDLVVRALRAGHSFASALNMIGEEMAEPVAGEFRAVHDEISFGVSMQQALTNLTVRIPSTDLRYFVVAVLIQRDSGGNLTELLSNLSQLMRERLKLAAKVRVMSTEGRLSAWILGLMPFVLGSLMYWANPAFMMPLWTDPIGQSMLKYLLIMMFFGALIMRELIKIRY
jgi:tight adherence protein B